MAVLKTQSKNKKLSVRKLKGNSHKGSCPIESASKRKSVARR